MPDRERILFITGKLAEPALRRVLADLSPRVGFDCEILVLPISVAALLTSDWVVRHIDLKDERFSRAILPGWCRGDITSLEKSLNLSVELGPKNLLDLPEYFRMNSTRDYGTYDIEIIAEINSVAELSIDSILIEARRLRIAGADIIDLGCDPGGAARNIGDIVRALKDEAFRVSIDSFDETEVFEAVRAGAELVLSVNETNLDFARGLHQHFPGIEFVVISDRPGASLNHTVEILDAEGIKFRIDPILEPIGIGFAASLGRYLETRKRYPNAALMMGVGNLTELTDVDSAGVNVLLAGFCQAQRIGSVLTTEVVDWCRTSVKELDIARRLVHHAVKNHIPPKRIDANLVMLRDPKVNELGEETLQELSRRIIDRNCRIFMERGEIHMMNAKVYVRGTDPFELLNQFRAQDDSLDVSHAFYLGYELAKAKTALTLGKNYVQDESLSWGFLTQTEKSHIPDDLV